jgi:hypothetical protein
MNYGAETCTGRAPSAFESAATDLASTQGQLSATIDSLMDRLSIALGPAIPQPDSKGVCIAPPASTIVGMLQDAADRDRYHIRKLQELLDRLTI